MFPLGTIQLAKFMVLTGINRTEEFHLLRYLMLWLLLHDVCLRSVSFDIVSSFFALVCCVRFIHLACIREEFPVLIYADCSTLTVCAL